MVLSEIYILFVGEWEPSNYIKSTVCFYMSLSFVIYSHFMLSTWLMMAFDLALFLFLHFFSFPSYPFLSFLSSRFAFFLRKLLKSLSTRWRWRLSGFTLLRMLPNLGRKYFFFALSFFFELKGNWSREEAILWRVKCYSNMRPKSAAKWAS